MFFDKNYLRLNICSENKRFGTCYFCLKAYLEKNKMKIIKNKMNIGKTSINPRGTLLACIWSLMIRTNPMFIICTIDYLDST